MPYAAAVNLSAGVAGPTDSVTAITAVQPAPTYAIPAGALTPGVAYRILARGTFTSSASATTTTFTLGIGAATIATTAGTLPASLTLAQWVFDAILTCRSVGSSGTIWVQGWADLNTSLTVGAPTHLLLPGSGPAAVTLDTTASANVALSITSSVAQTYICQQFIVEPLNIAG